MCGIFGLIARKSSLTLNETRDIVNTLFRLSETRGKESSGIAIKNLQDGKISVYKKPIRASKLIKAEDYCRFFMNSLESCFQEIGMAKVVATPFSLVSHTRLVTNGTQQNNDNNQPVIKGGAVIVHNGIIVNTEILWKKHSILHREYEVDTEIISGLIRSLMKHGKCIQEATSIAYKEISGSASIAMLMDNYDTLLIATNTGSLYWMKNNTNDTIIFASERYILSKFIEKNCSKRKFEKKAIQWVRPRTGYIVDLNKLIPIEFQFDQDEYPVAPKEDKKKDSIINLSGNSQLSESRNYLNTSIVNNQSNISLLEYNIKSINSLKRCSRCVLPESFPFIRFDGSGVCNYCRHYQKIQLQGIESLKERVAPFKNSDNRPDCLVTFSGGRDSSYCVHFVKRVLGMNPIAYTYDWGMVTDLARRNQARLCGKLGIEHIIVSADIRKKRDNIRKNVLAWLKKPDLGTIPLFMAGDKQYYYYANVLKKRNDLNLIIMGENYFEKTGFKTAFTGARQSQRGFMAYHISSLNKLRMLFYYAFQFMKNTAYLNSSIFDTLGAFFSYYIVPHNYINIYTYIKWDEDQINSILINEYDWEVSTDTTTTWRIGDGTVAFYNYIYYTITGFSENDTFRSNQIREGLMTREAALNKVNEENRPRYESIKWYLDTIGIDFEAAIKKINSIPKLYKVE